MRLYTIGLTSLSADDLAKGCPKFKPSTRLGIEPGTSWLAVRGLANCTNFTHITSLNYATHTVYIWFSALGTYLIFEPSGWALIRGGHLFEVGHLLNFQHFSWNSEKNSNILIDFSDNEIIDCEPLKKYRNNQYPFCFCTLYIPYLCFGGWGGALIWGWALKIILLGGGLGAYLRLGAY